ncbi:dTMP kinase [Holzapfeliella floricola]|uniref:Thymidylate kinase n=2 Tax=Holzapfeliella TaxID=2767883 RepID=A0A0R2DJE5_9LACO|nr:dTMP kinase [Holzapfeliella floricola]KRN04225.1 dTMP kinase [Holzapfeliella floricola DSM 23037 = JCM 16512]
MTGRFITLEGPDGSGKSTALKQLIKIFNQQTQDNLVLTREPGGSTIAEAIREIILNPDYPEMDDRTEALLYAASRRQHLVETVLPSLKADKTVISDRYLDSSLAYQGGGRELGIENVAEMNQFATENLMPDLTLYFDVNPEIGLSRIDQNREKDRLEQQKESFHERVYETYQELYRRYPKRIVKINANQSKQRVVDDTIKAMKDKFPELF